MQLYSSKGTLPEESRRLRHKTLPAFDQIKHALTSMLSAMLMQLQACTYPQGFACASKVKVIVSQSFLKDVQLDLRVFSFQLGKRLVLLHFGLLMQRLPLYMSYKL